MNYDNEIVTYAEEEILNINKMILDKIKISNKIIELDYYKYLKEKVDSYKNKDPLATLSEENGRNFN